MPRKKMQWKYRLALFMFAIVFVVIFLSFTAIYQVFMDTMQNTMLDTTTNAFVQAEKNIIRKLKAVQEGVNKLVYTDIVYDYETDNYKSKVEQAEGTVELIKAFDRTLGNNSDIFGMGIICTDGRIAASTKRNRTIGNGVITTNEKMDDLLRKSDVAYPEYIWVGNFEEYLSAAEGFIVITQEPVVVGIRSLGDYRDQGEERGYIITAIKETAIAECYAQIIYNENQVMLLENEKIISGTEKTRVGSFISYEIQHANKKQISQFQWRDPKAQEVYQIIQYNTVLEDWVLVNQIPKKIYENQTYHLKYISFLIGFATISVMCLFFILWILKYANPIQRLMNGMRKIEEGDYVLLEERVTGVKELDALNSQFNSMTKKLQDSILMLKKNEDALRIEELRTLQFQINPHFLLNSINTIRWMAMMSNNTNVADALVVLNKIIYPILKSPSFWGTVKDEVDFADNYIQMLKLRFSSTLTYGIKCKETLYPSQFPRFILQPIIENCFTHGIKQGEPLFVETIIEDKRGIFHICVYNSGKPMERVLMADLNAQLRVQKEKEELQETEEELHDSIGLRNVRKRLALLYGDKSRMWLESDFEDGTTVHIEFPNTSR